MRIQPLVTIEPLKSLRDMQATESSPKAASQSFGQALEQAVDQVNTLQTEADKLAQDLASGKLEDLHTVMVAMSKASLALEFTIQVRNKVIEAYQELMRTQV